MNRKQLWLCVSSSCVALLASASAKAVPVINASGGNGVITDLLDAAQGGKIDGTASTPNPIFAYDRAIGVTGGGGETTNTIFADSGAGVTQSFVVRTPSPIKLDSFDLILAQDGGTSFRSATSARVYASNDNITYTEISDTTDVSASLSNYFTNFGSGVLTVSDTPGATAQFFRVETVSAVNGPRIREFDGFGTVVPVIVDPNIFNAASNTGVVDEPAGLSFNFSVSSAVAGDDPQGAFGNNNGPIELASFIFADGATPDNGNKIFGDSGETVDFIQWQTSSRIGLNGYQITLAGDGLDSATRGAELIRFLVNGVQVDLFDNDHLSGTVNRLFAGGPVSGDLFRIEFTRSSATGARINEINAIMAPIPEPATISLLGLTALALLRRRRTV